MASQFERDIAAKVSHIHAVKMDFYNCPFFHVRQLLYCWSLLVVNVYSSMVGFSIKVSDDFQGGLSHNFLV